MTPHTDTPTRPVAPAPTASAETLCGIDAFSRLDGEQRRRLARRCRFQHYPRGRQIVTVQHTGRDVFFIVSGRVQATVFSLSGRQVTLEDLGPGAMFGELAAIDGRPRSAHVVAVTDTLACSLTPQDFNDALARYPSVNRATLWRLSGMVRELSGRVFEASALPVKHRLHAELLRLALAHLRDDGSALIEPSPTHAELAHRIGTHREGVSREFARLRRAGLVGGRRRALLITDVAALRERVSAAVG